MAKVIKSIPAKVNLHTHENLQAKRRVAGYARVSIKYAGYFYDAETGLYYLNARFYDPETARFIQQDSYSGDILDPLSLNLYTYAQNNPISYYDPTGHSIKSLFKKAANTVKKVYNTVRATATVAKPVVKQAVKTAATVAVNTTFKKITTPIANTIKAAANKTENQRAAFQTVLAVGKSVQSPVVNAWANYAQGEYDTLAGQIDGFMQFSENPAHTIGNSVNYFLSDPLKNNPVYGAGKWCSEFKSAVASNDWNTASYKLGVGVVNTAEVAGSIAIGGKIDGKIPTGKVSVPKVNALSKIGNAIDNFGAPSLAGANGIVISGAVPAEVSVSSSVSAGVLGVRAGVVAGPVAVSNIYYSGKGSGQSSCGEILNNNSAIPAESKTNVEWSNHGYKHFPQSNMAWKEIVKSSKNGPAKYTPGTNIEKLERIVWEKGTPVTNGKTWKVMKFNDVIGASAGAETNYIRVEFSGGTIHGHPITKVEYNKLLK